MLATPGTSTAATSQRHLQGLVARRTAAAEPKNAAQYFGHVADVVSANEALAKTRTYNLRRCTKVAYRGYEAVLNRKKRAVLSHNVKPSAVNMLYVSRPTAISTGTTAFNPAAALALHAMLPRPQTIAAKPSPKLATGTPGSRPMTSAVIPSTTLATPTVTTSAASTAAGRMTPTQMQMHQQQMQNAQLQIQQAKRSDFVVGTTVLIRSTSDLIACGARNLTGKTGRIVAAPQLYGQELFSVYFDEHEALFQIPFNALSLVSRPTTTQQSQNAQQMQQMQAQLAATAGRLVPNQAQRPSPNANAQAHRTARSVEQIKMEHSFQLHRLMQQQYREIQVLQQRYAECRLVNPTALSGIQKELSKLRLVHLSQVQTLKSKQALDMIGK
ncbi:hypothetical protein JM18_004247 [Phytophthora kernoviae]|uniref:Uncharacterized protein n=2 Tax=Phytophthora kernoviae TaxID=325452 RepID=A0A8T0MA27_9STRA|nr:hypothetical protein G195_005371 [Phytophthora kernoviae 00238/432]KAG2526719.1 hypothetical protein JM18_004247 [Phytophthora kernoviae]KAG2531356.1 hypothetical protein JM16_001103 [Phytophthora kernoviae]